MAIFDKYPEYYDLFYNDKSYDKEALYVKEIIEKYSNLVPKGILDLGCGTGKHAHEFSKLGINVHGIDSSKTMIEIAKNSYSNNPSLTWEIGDVSNIKTKNKFDSIVSLFHVMSYQTTDEQICACFDQVQNHLNDDGIFVFDFWYGPAVLKDEPYSRSKTVPLTNGYIKRTSYPKHISEENIVKVKFEFEINQKEQVVETFEETHTMRYFFMPELEKMLQMNGLKILKALPWMQLDGSPSDDNWYICILACK